MNFCAIFCYVLLCNSQSNAETERKQHNLKVPRGTYDDIVKNLIKTWELPVMYLKQVGYLPQNYKDTSQIKPNLDALIIRIARAETQANRIRHRPAKENIPCNLEIENIKMPMRGRWNDDGKRAHLEEKREDFDELLQRSKQKSKPSEDNLVEHAEKQDMHLESKMHPSAHTVTSDSKALHKHSFEPLGYMEKTVNNTSDHTANDSVVPSPNAVAVTHIKSLYFINGQLKNTDKNRTQNALESSHIDTQEKASYRPQSIGDYTTPLAVETHKRIESPKYLNWDMKNKRLLALPVEKDAYLDHIIKVFAQKRGHEEVERRIDNSS